jgi:hypothetical protein
VRNKSWLLLPALTLSLSGCSNEPSAGEIDKAVRQEMTNGRAQMQRLGASPSMVGEINNVEKLACKEETKVRYRCDVEIDLTQSGNRAKGPASFAFIKGSNGWSLSK